MPAPESTARNDFLLRYLEPIKLLKDLRILHVYQDNIRKVAPSRLRTKDQVADDAHQLAIRFFRDVHPYCPLLNVLVWGNYGEPSEGHIQGLRDDANDEGVTIEQTSQYLFVKRKETLGDGRMQITAVSVTLSRLRDEFPYLELLTYDPGHLILERVFSSAVLIN
ncbi:Nn.00g019380.m01.CDS01 [Neocucurbitaria sp. VM-36]